jgi:hypothetical protein
MSSLPTFLLLPSLTPSDFCQASPSVTSSLTHHTTTTSSTSSSSIPSTIIIHHRHAKSTFLDTNTPHRRSNIQSTNITSTCINILHYMLPSCHHHFMTPSRHLQHASTHTTPSHLYDTDSTSLASMDQLLLNCRQPSHTSTTPDR